MKRVAVLAWLVLLLAVSVHWVGQAQQPPPAGAAGDDPHFTGKAIVMDG